MNDLAGVLDEDTRAKLEAFLDQLEKKTGAEFAILAVGTMVNYSLAAAESLASEGLDVTVVNCRFLKPYDAVTLAALLADHKHLLVVEEGIVVNGFGAYITTVVQRMDPSVRVVAQGSPIAHYTRVASRAALTGPERPGTRRRPRDARE